MRVTKTTNQSTKDFYSFQSRPGDSDTHLGRVDSKVLQLTSKPYPPWIPPIMPSVGSLMDCKQLLYYGRLHGVYHITMINSAVCLLRGTTYWKLREKKEQFWLSDTLLKAGPLEYIVWRSMLMELWGSWRTETLQPFWATCFLPKKKVFRLSFIMIFLHQYLEAAPQVHFPQ